MKYLIIVLLVSSVIFSIEPVIEFEKGYGPDGVFLGGDVGAWGSDVVETPDGGFLATGTHWRDYGDPSGHDANGDIYLVKTDVHGNIQWKKNYGDSPQDDEAYALTAVSNGGYAITGVTKSWSTNNLDVVFLLRVDSQGEFLWKETYPEGKNNIISKDVIQTRDGGFLIAGSVIFPPSDHLFSRIIKTDLQGNIEWKWISKRPRTFPRSVLELNDGYLVCGADYLRSRNINYTAYLAKFNFSGSLVWEKIHEGSAFSQIKRSRDGNLILCNELITKLDVDGNVIWKSNPWNWEHGLDSAYGTSSIDETPDGGFVIAGGADLPSPWDPTFSVLYFLITRFDSMGNKIWERTFGESYLNVRNVGLAIQTTSSGAYIACGKGVPAGGRNPFRSLYLIKIAPDGNLLPPPVEISRAELLQESKVMLSWENNSNVNVKEHILYRESEKGWENIARLGSDTSFYVDENVQEGEKYCWYMAVTNAMGAGPFSSPVCLTIPFKPPPPPKPALFVRGDSNADNVIDISDGIKTLLALFQGQSPHTCPDAMDSNDDGKVNLADAIFIFHFLLGDNTAKPHLPEPFSQCGYDVSEDALTCSAFSPCDGK